jgi:hypothetical protein
VKSRAQLAEAAMTAEMPLQTDTLYDSFPIRSKLNYWNRKPVDQAITIVRRATREEYEEWCLEHDIDPTTQYKYFYWFVTD